MSLWIGHLELKNPLILAPMAGFTDLPFRRCCRRLGATLAHTEMISAAGMVKGSASTRRLLATDSSDRPLSVQLFGAEPYMLVEAARICQDEGADLVDLNMGCPVPKVIRKGAGAALLRDHGKVGKILGAMRGVLEVPFTIKMRAGWTEREHAVIELGRIAQDCGVDALTLHPRARNQGYAIPADWRLIGDLKSRLSIPVVGNGDVRDARDAKSMIDLTGCDGVMIGRGALGNPWIFSRALRLLQDLPPLPSPSLSEIRRVFEDHLRDIGRHYDQTRAVNAAKRHAMKYLRGLPAIAGIREEVARTSGLEDLMRIASSFLDRLEKRSFDQRAGTPRFQTAAAETEASSRWREFS